VLIAIIEKYVGVHRFPTRCPEEDE